MIGPNARNVEKPWVAELIIEEVIKDKKQRILKALDFKYQRYRNKNQ